METFGITTACHHVASRPHGAVRAAPRTRHKSGLRRWRYQQEWAHPELDDFDSDDNDSSCCCADEDLNDKSRDRGKRLRYSKTRLAVLVKPACKVFLHAMASSPASFDHWRYSMDGWKLRDSQLIDQSSTQWSRPQECHVVDGIQCTGNEGADFLLMREQRMCIVRFTCLIVKD